MHGLIGSSAMKRVALRSFMRFKKITMGKYKAEAGSFVS